MFNSIFGIITAKNPKQIFIETNGIEWDICIPDSSLDMLPCVGKEARVYTYMQHTENAMALFGFASKEERNVFFDLLKVDGIGAKGAIKIMSNISSFRLMEILENSNLDELEKIPGIGKKTAGKMLLALKGKISISEEKVQSSFQSTFNDVAVSLASMGFDKKDVDSKIEELLRVLSTDESFMNKTKKEKEEILFRRAIVEMS